MPKWEYPEINRSKILNNFYPAVQVPQIMSSIVKAQKVQNNRKQQACKREICPTLKKKNH
jgi:hypothetical protein